MRVRQLQVSVCARGVPFYPVAPRALPEKPGHEGAFWRGSGLGGAFPTAAAAESVLGGAGEQAELGVKHSCRDLGQVSKLTSYSRNGMKPPLRLCEPQRGQPCSQTLPGLTCHPLCADVRL